MTKRVIQGVEALTEKERQTLRLIVRGHDAKSIARHLDLSVHTINERLRDARRKLNVSSSREAARMLLDAEGEPPISSGDTIIGEAVKAPNLQQNGDAEWISRLSWVKIGGIVVALLLGLIALLTLTQQATTADAGRGAMIETKNPAIISVARRFLELGDRGNWTATYRMTSSDFQKSNSFERWAQIAEKTRAPLGAVHSRILLSEQNLPAPPFGYEVVRFRTTFASKTNLLETVTLEHANGVWKVAGVTMG